MKRSAFTLLETMIALAIVVVGLGAGAALSRSVFLAGQQSEDQIQAATLVEDAYGLVSATQREIQAATRADKTLSGFFALTAGVAKSIVPFNSASAGQPLALNWCAPITGQPETGGSVVCNAKISDVDGAALSSFFASGEKILVNRADADGRSVIDLTSSTGTVVSSANPNWDVYQRQIQLTKQTLVAGSAATYNLAVQVKNLTTGYTVNRQFILTDSL